MSSCSDYADYNAAEDVGTCNQRSAAPAVTDIHNQANTSDALSARYWLYLHLQWEVQFCPWGPVTLCHPMGEQLCSAERLLN